MKKNKLNKILFDKPSNIFILIANVTINISWVFLLGVLINKSIKHTIIIIATWSISLLMGKAKHYSSPLKCFLLQIFLFSTIFLSIYINIYVACIFTIFSKYLLSGNADIDEESKIDNKPNFRDFTFWRPKDEESIHQPLIDYLKYNALTDEYLEAEKILKSKVDSKTFLIYKRKFIDGYTYEKIRDEFEISNPRIKECLDKCYYYLVGRLKI